MSGLHIDDVSMTFELPGGGDVEALKNINLNIRNGELLSVLGPSGCGKTTLLNILAGFLAPTGGKIMLNDHRVTGPDSERGMVFQQGALFEWMSVSKNIGFGPSMKGTPASQIKQRVDELLGIVGLQDFGDKMIYELSGGMQQRVALARCLANDPDVILMDEPLGALDALTREKMQSLVLDIWKKTGKTIILITHSVEEALLLGERLLVMAPRPANPVPVTSFGAMTINKTSNCCPGTPKPAGNFVLHESQLMNLPRYSGIRACACRAFR